ncbi:MAG: CYTH domain-containing protein [Bacteroidia bacterium]|nr:CYTH domain-containing protein [Bacteroidia bacterium]
MGQEIERKFLIKGDYKKHSVKSLTIKQGYISTVNGITVRVRLKDKKGYLTIKGASGESGISRYEWEKEIAFEEADELLRLCDSGIIDKTRYLIPAGNFTWEVDEFHGENEGLVMAEIELKSESDTFSVPDWLGQEVTGDFRYYNSYIAKNPFTRW